MRRRVMGSIELQTAEEILQRAKDLWKSGQQGRAEFLLRALSLNPSDTSKQANDLLRSLIPGQNSPADKGVKSTRPTVSAKALAEVAGRIVRVEKWIADNRAKSVLALILLIFAGVGTWLYRSRPTGLEAVPITPPLALELPLFRPG